MGPGHCPRCNAALAQRLHGLYDDILVHECDACGGAFYPVGSLNRLDDSIMLDAEALEYVRGSWRTVLRCPSCRREGYREGHRDRTTGLVLEALTHPARPDLVVRRCPNCRGFWLEPGNLDQVRELLLELSKGTLVIRPPRRR